MLWASIDSVFCAWRGPSLLVANQQGQCDPQVPLTGYYFRETRYLKTCRLTINRRDPWRCAAAAIL